MIGIKIIAGIEIVFAVLFGVLTISSRVAFSPILMAPFISLGLAVGSLITKQRKIGIIFISVGGAVLIISIAFFAVALWVISAMW